MPVSAENPRDLIMMRRSCILLAVRNLHCSAVMAEKYDVVRLQTTSVCGNSNTAPTHSDLVRVFRQNVVVLAEPIDQGPNNWW